MRSATQTAAQALEIFHLPPGRIELALQALHHLLDLVELTLDVLYIPATALDRPIEQPLAHPLEFLDPALDLPCTTLGHAHPLGDIDEFAVRLLHVLVGPAVVSTETAETPLDLLETLGRALAATLEFGPIALDAAGFLTDPRFGVIDVLETVLETTEALTRIPGLTAGRLAACGIPGTIRLTILGDVLEITAEIAGSLGLLVERTVLAREDLLPHLEVAVLGSELTETTIELVDHRDDLVDLALETLALAAGRPDVRGQTSRHGELLVELTFENALLLAGLLALGLVAGPILLETVDLITDPLHLATHVLSAGSRGTRVGLDALTQLLDGRIGAWQGATDELIPATQGGCFTDESGPPAVQGSRLTGHGSGTIERGPTRQHRPVDRGGPVDLRRERIHRRVLHQGASVDVIEVLEAC